MKLGLVFVDEKLITVVPCELAKWWDIHASGSHEVWHEHYLSCAHILSYFRQVHKGLGCRIETCLYQPHFHWTLD